MTTPKSLELSTSVEKRLSTASRRDRVSVLVLTINEAGNIASVLGRVARQLERAGVDYELVVVDGGSTDSTVEEARSSGARVVEQAERGYGNALREGFSLCTGDYILTLDADQSHDPAVVLDLLDHRGKADVVIASRYVMFGHANMPVSRLLLSRDLNGVYATVLGLPVRDISSGFRLYRRSVIDGAGLRGENFDILPEIIVRAYANGYRVAEIPFHYRPRREGKSHVRLFKFGRSYVRTLTRYWALRNSIDSADYDYRAFHSRHPVQRYWQRRRYAIVTGYVEDYETGADIGCGSSVILDSLPGVVGVDISQKKLRFLKGHLRNPLLRGDVRALPFATASLDLLVCSQVIEHVVYDEAIFEEFRRVVRPGGTLVLGTPDYAKLAWRVTEWLYTRLAPGAYGDEHITHYTLASLTELLSKHGFEPLAHAYVGGGELIVKARRG
jgi:dolichol-phosphate mannosyltransferase